MKREKAMIIMFFCVCVVWVTAIICISLGEWNKPIASDGTTSSVGGNSVNEIIKTNNEFFKTRVVTYDDAGSYIIQNKVTGEYFLVVHELYGVSMCPIVVNNREEVLYFSPAGAQVEK